MSTDIQVGDRVRVVIEDSVATVSEEFVGTGKYLFPTAGDEVISMEKVTPPPITFVAGDRVRSLESSGCEYTVGVNGFYDHTTNRVVPREVVFTSANYEKVEVPA